MAGVGLWVVVLLWRLVDLQVVRREEFTKKARKQHERTVELPPRRGQITDAAGRSLAVTAQVDSVFAIPSEVENPASAAATLASILDVPRKELEKKLDNPERDFVWVARRVPEETAQRVAARHLPGVRLVKESTRRYPQGAFAAAVLGYVGADNQGLAGLEYRYDSEVRGRPAHVTFLRDAARRFYASPGTDGRGRSALADGVEGASLVLTLDSAIQHTAERELDAAVEKWQAKGGSAVVLDPETGAVLALASNPSFDPNRYGESDADSRRCRPVTDVYEPGSTFKIITAAGALEKGTVSPDDLIDCGGGALTIGSTTIHEHGRNRWSVLSLADVIAHSSNIGIAHVGLGLGRGPFHANVRSFGFGQKTGIDLDGETVGILANPSTWSALTLPTMSFGQEIGVTVVQMARAYAAIANGGVLPTLRIVGEVRRPDGRIVRVEPPQGPRVISEGTARELRRLLSRVVEAGTGKLASIPGYTVAGKTGTAQKANPGGGYSRDRHVASFIGFVPAETPRLVIAVVVDEPKGKIYGGDVAAPVFASIGAEALRVRRVPAQPSPDRIVPTILTADLSRNARSETGPVLSGDLVPTAHRAPRVEAEEGTIPGLDGMAANEAARRLAQRGYVPKLVGHGFVVSQDPPAGTPAGPGTPCTLVLSLVPPVTNAALALPEEPGAGR